MSESETRFSRPDLLLGGVLIIEFLLFRTYVIREISMMIPSDVDQSVYLNETYSMYSFLVNANWKEFINHIFHMYNTGLPIVGVIFLYLFGNSRLSLLIPNFCGFAVLQIVGYRMTNRLYKKNYIGLIYVGLLLLTKTPFVWAANLTGYRADFLFACLFGIWIMLLFEAVRTSDCKLLNQSALIAGILLFIRFYAVVFVVCITLVAVFLDYRKGRSVKGTCLYIIKYAVVCLCGGVGFLLLI